MFRGKTILITGASSGIGEAMSEAFAKEGAFVGMIARRKDRLEEIERKISSVGGQALALPADVTDELSMQAALEKLVARTGRLDVLVNNAATGVFGRKPTEEEYLRIFDVNVHSVYRLTESAIPYLEATSGTILNVGSSVTDRPFAGELVYTATKGAITAMTKAMAVTYGKRGIRVNLLQPGVVASEFNQNAGLSPEIDRAMYEQSEKLNALPTTGKADDVAEAAMFLCSEKARFITGESFKVDGGITLAGIHP